MVFGIDASNVNGHIDWPAVAKDVRFAHLKASEGGSFIDAEFRSNTFKARAAGLHVGPYHFARPEHHPGAVGARIEAQFFFSCVGGVRPGSWDIRPTLDLELGSGDLTIWAGAFLSEIERLTGVRPLLYTYTALSLIHI